MMSSPEVAILILNWNNYHDTKRCLDSLAKLSYSAYSIVLIDNGSTDKSGLQIKKEYQDIHHIKIEQNQGFAGGNNVGIGYILERGIPYILLLNNDTEVIQPDFLTKLIHEMNEVEHLGAIGPRVHKMDGSDQDTILPYPTLGVTVKSTLGLYKNDLDQKQFADSVSGCCVLVRSDVIADVGYLDENIFFYGEETEWFYRMRKKGWKIGFLPVLSIIHKGAASSKNIEDSTIYIERRSNVIYTLVKHNQTLRAVLMYFLMNLLLVYRILVTYLFPANRFGKQYSLVMISDFYQAVSKKWEYAKVTSSD